ncbi:putative serine/threonine-protein kinase [Nemania abortiva]|nr:putative serine/threonine-protein kinase [Nemania abortiva]
MWSLNVPRKPEPRPPPTRLNPTNELHPFDTRLDESDPIYPVNVGDILDERYEVKARIGERPSYTIWLARDISLKHDDEPERYVAIQVCANNREDDEYHEGSKYTRKAYQGPVSRGRGIIATALESFTFESDRDSDHVALVFDIMKNPVWLLRREITGGEPPGPQALPLIKVYLRTLLQALDFLHSLRYIHTDLKLEDIMLEMEHLFVIENLPQQQKVNLLAPKCIDCRAVHRYHHDPSGFLGKGAQVSMYPKMFEPANPQPEKMSNESEESARARRLFPIQSEGTRAPEVFFGIGWSYSTDIWNFGIIAWELLTNSQLFKQDDTNSYSAVQHVADMVALLGPIPPELIAREKEMREWELDEKVENPSGRLCKNITEYLGGPFFTDDGKFVGDDLVSRDRVWENEIPECVPSEEADQFFKFMRRMLCWVPEKRATAEELKDDRWLNGE